MISWLIACSAFEADRDDGGLAEPPARVGVADTADGEDVSPGPAPWGAARWNDVGPFECRSTRLPDGWSYDFGTTGPAGQVVVTLVAADGWVEHHALQASGSGEQYRLWSGSALVVDDRDDYIEGESTWFDCFGPMEPDPSHFFVVTAGRVWDEDGMLSDCVYDGISGADLTEWSALGCTRFPLY